jgi:hypothetical protein
VSGSTASCSADLIDGLGSCKLVLGVPGAYTLTANYTDAYSFASSSDTEQHTVVPANCQIYLPLIGRP